MSAEAAYAMIFLVASAGGIIGCVWIALGDKLKARRKAMEAAERQAAYEAWSRQRREDAKRVLGEDVFYDAARDRFVSVSSESRGKVVYPYDLDGCA